LGIFWADLQDFLIAVDGVDDKRQKLRDFSLELELFRHCGWVVVVLEVVEGRGSFAFRSCSGKAGKEMET
jgi:hypothetical protein